MAFLAESRKCVGGSRRLCRLFLAPGYPNMARSIYKMDSSLVIVYVLCMVGGEVETKKVEIVRVRKNLGGNGKIHGRNTGV